VTVVGGDPAAMGLPLADAGVRHVRAANVTEGLAALARGNGARPDLVHSHMTAADLAAVGGRPFHRAPCVSTLHFAQPRGHSAIRRSLYRVLPSCFREQIAISRFVADTCGTPTVVIPNGVPDRAPPGAPREPVVLVAQRLESEKDTALALRIWQRASLRTRGWRLEVAGRGAERAGLEALAARLGIDESVRFLGFVDDVGALMARASVMLATAPAEPFGLSVVEAMAAGLPVVAADGGAHREVLDSFGDQRFRIGDSDAGAAALERLADDQTTRVHVADAARRRYEEQYTIEHHVDRLLDVYESVLR
jgi:glycosyltransferase involved in cell wall biosynthesis